MEQNPLSSRKKKNGCHRKRWQLYFFRKSRAGSSRVDRRSTNIGFQKGQCPFCRVQRQRLWQGLGQRPKVDRRSTMPSGAPQRVNFQTVQWTVWKEVIPHGVGKCREATKGTARSAPCKRGRSLINLMFVHKKTERNFPL